VVEAGPPSHAVRRRTIVAISALDDIAKTLAESHHGDAEENERGFFNRNCLRLPSTLEPVSKWTGLSILFGVAVVAYLIVRLLVMPLVRKAAHRTSITWDEVLAGKKVLNRISWLVPLLIIRIGLASASPSDIGWVTRNLPMTERVLDASILVLALLMIGAVANTLETLYSRTEAGRHRPIKGYIQVGLIFLWLIGIVLTIAILTGQQLGVLLGGVGAFSAIVLLVFRDTILSLVASLQLTNNDMVRIGDWLEMPSHHADGEVEDIALHTVRIRNWDKTVTSIPTYKLVTEPYKNWRGMTESGGRRIKRAIPIDAGSIRFLTETEVEHWSSTDSLSNHMRLKKAELEEWNKQVESGAKVAEKRRLTNLGTFRAYIDWYLGNHPSIKQNMTRMVRQLDPTDKGIPLELYCFTNTTDWAAYEAIQADIFDHLTAIIPEFGLRIHQSPTGSDLKAIVSS